MKFFDSVRLLKPKRNKFDLSHERKMTMNMGPLYPCLVQEVLPGDTFRVSSQVFLRFLALIAPVMHRVDVTVHFFNVPNRLIWDNWQDFITGGRDGLAAPNAPYFSLNAINTISPNHLKAGSLLDYMGFPTLKNAGTFQAGYSTYQFNALPLRAYQLIYDTYYRDQNVEASILTTGFKGDGSVTGADLAALVPMRTRAWEKDYLTSCLPWTQRGGAVSIPITGTVVAPSGGAASPTIWRDVSTGAASMVSGQILGGVNPSGHAGRGTAIGSTTTPVYYDPQGSLTVTSSSLTINALRLSNQLQVWLERNARAGGRYIEQLAAHFGIISSDARLQRPEYLGGGKSPVVVSEVLQTAPQAAGTPTGTMAGHGVSVGNTNTFKAFFEEHGFVIGLISVLPRTAYQQYCDPMWISRNVNTGYYFPEFANLGEQAVTNGMAYSDWGDAAAAAGWGNTFGYQSRFADYKYSQDQVAGQFKESLAYWHFGRVFASQPALNATFIQAVPRTDPFAVTTDVDHLVVQIFHRIDALRPIPYFSEPRL